jgi:hypothetical protein
MTTKFFLSTIFFNSRHTQQQHEEEKIKSLNKDNADWYKNPYEVQCAQN